MSDDAFLSLKGYLSSLRRILFVFPVFILKKLEAPLVKPKLSIYLISLMKLYFSHDLSLSPVVNNIRILLKIDMWISVRVKLMPIQLYWHHFYKPLMSSVTQPYSSLRKSLAGVVFSLPCLASFTSSKPFLILLKMASLLSPSSSIRTKSRLLTNSIKN